MRIESIDNDFRTPFRPHTSVSSSARSLSQSEYDWNYAKRALARGRRPQDPNFGAAKKAILYRLSMGNPALGLMFHSGAGEPMDLDKLAQRIVRPAVEAIRLEWYGGHGFRRGIASNLYELGANDKQLW